MIAKIRPKGEKVAENSNKENSNRRKPIMTVAESAQMIQDFSCNSYLSSFINLSCLSNPSHPSSLSNPSSLSCPSCLSCPSYPQKLFTYTFLWDFCNAH